MIPTPCLTTFDVLVVVVVVDRVPFAAAAAVIHFLLEGADRRKTLFSPSAALLLLLAFLDSLKAVSVRPLVGKNGRRAAAAAAAAAAPEARRRRRRGRKAADFASFSRQGKPAPTPRPPPTTGKAATFGGGPPTAMGIRTIRISSCKTIICPSTVRRIRLVRVRMAKAFRRRCSSAVLTTRCTFDVGGQEGKVGLAGQGEVAGRHGEVERRGRHVFSNDGGSIRNSFGRRRTRRRRKRR